MFAKCRDAHLFCFHGLYVAWYLKVMVRATVTVRARATFRVGGRVRMRGRMRVRVRVKTSSGKLGVGGCHRPLGRLTQHGMRLNTRNGVVWYILLWVGLAAGREKCP